jgi:hypothetical protein
VREEKRKRDEEERKARGMGVNPMLHGVVKFKIERRVSSDDLMLPDVSRPALPSVPL